MGFGQSFDVKSFGQAAALQLGLCGEQWDSRAWPQLHVEWGSLCEQERYAVSILGLTEEDWWQTQHVNSRDFVQPF